MMLLKNTGKLPKYLLDNKKNIFCNDYDKLNTYTHDIIYSRVDFRQKLVKATEGTVWSDMNNNWRLKFAFFLILQIEWRIILNL